METQLRPPPKRGRLVAVDWGHSPHQFSAHVYCRQNAGCITIPLGTKVGLVPDDSVLDRTPPPPKKGGTAAQFSALVYCGETVAHLSYC